MAALAAGRPIARATTTHCIFDGEEGAAGLMDIGVDKVRPALVAIDCHRHLVVTPAHSAVTPA